MIVGSMYPNMVFVEGILENKVSPWTLDRLLSDSPYRTAH